MPRLPALHAFAIAVLYPAMFRPPNSLGISDTVGTLNALGLVDTSEASNMLGSLSMLSIRGPLGVGYGPGFPNAASVPITLGSLTMLLVLSLVVERPLAEQSDRCVAWQLPSRGDNLPFWTHKRQSPFKVFSAFSAASPSDCLKLMRMHSQRGFLPNSSKSPGKFWYCFNLSRIDLMVEPRMVRVMGHRPMRKSSRK